MTVGRVASVTLQCAEPHPLAQFWAAAAGGEIAYSTEDFVAVTLPGGQWLTCARDPEFRPPVWPSNDVRLHLDLSVADLDAAQRVAVGLGATVADSQPAPDRWRVLIDPAGHPFCVSRLIPD